MRPLTARAWPLSGTLRVTLLSLAILAALVLLPNFGPTLGGSAPVVAWHARVTAILDPHRPDPTGSGGGFLPDARVLLLEGPLAGTEVEAYRQGPGGQQDGNAYRVGEDVVVTSTGNPQGGTFLAIEDRWRLPQLVGLTGLFAAAVVAVGRWRGVRALLGLALTAAALLKLLIPALVAGIPPIPAAVVVATGLTVLVIGLTEGLGRSSVAAILGTAAALTLTAILAAVVTALAGFTNTLGSDLAALALPNGAGLDLRGILLAAFMIGSIGVLDDVTVTQATAVEELARAGLRGRALSSGAFAIGRSHIAATVNTLFLAYAGASLPLLILLAVGNQPLGLLINGETISIEIVRTLVGSLGIVAAVPLTTVIATGLAGRAARQPDSLSPGVALVGGLSVLAVVTLVAGVILGPLTSSGQRAPLVPDSFGGGAGASPSAGPTASASAPGGSPTASSSNGGLVFAAGEEIPLFGADGSDVGTVRVGQIEPHAPGGSGGLTIDIEFVYHARHEMTIDPTVWLARSTSGTTAEAQSPDDPAHEALRAAKLAAGHSRTGWLRFTLSDAPAALDLDYREYGAVLFSVSIY
ncbi:MAG: hypothetical protein QOI00_811 [Chloroflexota bacterium]|nr:hypothetical protein [Chloroflexota bacterium]